MQHWSTWGCDSSVYLKIGYWIGLCPGDRKWLCTAPCPYGFCSYNHVNSNVDRNLLPNSADQLDPIACGEHRPEYFVEIVPQITQSILTPGNTLVVETITVIWAGYFTFYLRSFLPPFFFLSYLSSISVSQVEMSIFILYAQLLDALAISNGTLLLSGYK